jgi:hypothetical protein
MASPSSPLRERMSGDMKLRNMSPLTQASYIRAVRNFSRYFHQPPDRLDYEHVRSYLLHLNERGLTAQAINQIACALRFFYAVTLGRDDASKHIPLARRPDTLPGVLTPDEVARSLRAVPSLKYKAAFATIYAAGLRISEATALRVADIDSSRMVSHVRQGKGRKDRIVMLSEQLFDHCVHFFATAEYLMKGARIKEVYALKSDISWMNDEKQYTLDRSEMNIYRPEAAGDIPIMTWTYDDPACQGIWMRAEALNGKYDPMYGFSVSVIGDKGMIEVLGEGGRGLQWQGKDVHLVLHRKDKNTLTFRIDEGGDDIWQSEVSY